MNHRRSLATGLTLAVLLGMGLVTGLAGVGPQPAAAQDRLPATPGDQPFRVEFSATPDGAGTARITGYVYNSDGRAADGVHLKIVELDASGYAIVSYVERLPHTVPARGRAYFDVKVPDDAAFYRVVVDSWNPVD
jgi:hypothetical protein